MEPQWAPLLPTAAIRVMSWLVGTPESVSPVESGLEENHSANVGTIAIKNVYKRCF